MILDTNKKLDELQEPNQNSEVVLAVNGVSKKFCRDLKRSLFYGVQDIASDLTGLRTKSDKLRKKEFWALDNVSFELRRGEALGLVGKNGSGKSTLLRIIAGLIKPDLGTVEIKGIVAPLIALGAGFNPILTGRENIYANMSILGLSTKEIDERFDDVVEFAEIEDAIDAPVQSYSSGMSARLGFASAIHTEPDILLIDEVLAVGDAKFRAKCYRKLHQLREQNTSFILVNHDIQAILNICDSAIYLSQGKLLASGDTSTVTTQYEEDLFSYSTESSSGAMYLPPKSESNSLGLDLLAIGFKDSQGNTLDSLSSGEHVIFCVNFYARKTVKNLNLHLKIRELARDGNTVLFLSNGSDDRFFEVFPGEHKIQLHMPYLSLIPGAYTMSVKIKDGNLATFDFIESFRFIVKSDKSLGQCILNQSRAWEVID